MKTVKKKWVFIINPVAGNGAAKLLIPRLENILTLKMIDAEIVFTEKPGHASELSAYYYNKGFNYIIGVGGDGTLN